jgi:NAD-specific glutamate dehydrogenase
MARNSMRENLYALQGRITAQVLETSGRRQPEQALTSWSEARTDRIRHVRATIGEMRAQGQMDFPTLGVAMQEIRRLTQS